MYAITLKIQLLILYLGLSFLINIVLCPYDIPFTFQTDQDGHNKKRWFYPVYPNSYVVFVGQSGDCIIDIINIDINYMLREHPIFICREEHFSKTPLYFFQKKNT